MIINAIIAEYNPFHTGHAYQLSECKRRLGADYTIVVMSGDFVQRGEPAIVNKYIRTKMALSGGADLVIELPTLYAASSAEFFATGAISILNKLGCVNTLSFGSECGDISLLTSVAEILASEPEDYVRELKRGLQQGMSFPIARNWALFSYQPELITHGEILTSPNNILAIEYLKSLIRSNSSITPYTIKRVGSGYHDRNTENTFCSALALRQAILGGHSPDSLNSYFTAESLEILSHNTSSDSLLTCNNFSTLLYYRLISEANTGFSRYLDVSEELSCRIQNQLFSFRSFSQFCELLKTKEMTYTRISRCLLHIVLGITKEDMALAAQNNHASFARILGFRKASGELLHLIKQHSSIPLISKPADVTNLLDEASMYQWDNQIRYNHIYAGVAAAKSGKPVQNEYQQPIVII